MSLGTPYDLSGSANTTVFTATGNGATANLLLCNRTGAPINVSVAVVKNGQSVANGNWIEYQYPLSGNRPLERGGLALDVGDFIVVNPSAGGVSAIVSYIAI